MTETGHPCPSPQVAPNCRFYGRAYSYHFGLVDNDGSNQCGLFTQTITPCRMEQSQLVPEERVCPYIFEVGRVISRRRKGAIGGRGPHQHTLPDLTMEESADAIMARLSVPGVKVSIPPTPNPRDPE